MKPMLAATWDLKSPLRFPVLATPKIDGIRCIITEKGALTRSLKPIPNLALREKLIKTCPIGFDGELVTDDSFQQTTSVVMTQNASASGIKYLVFDYIAEELPYEERVALLKSPNPLWITVLRPTRIDSLEQLFEYERECLENKFEGVCFRTPESPYKFGRSTLREQYLVKMKRFMDTEATIVGFTEEMENTNPKTINELGLTERASCKDNLVPKGTLGAFIVRNEMGTFSVGSGFTAYEREMFWAERHNLVGKTITVKFLPHGVKELPRHPVFKGFRNE